MLLLLHPVAHGVPFLFPPSSSPPLFNFSRACCSPSHPRILLHFSAPAFLSSPHACLLVRLPFQVHLPFLSHFNALCALRIIILPFLSIIPCIPLCALSETVSADTRPSPQPPSSFKVCDPRSFSATLLCYASTVSVLAHLHQHPHSAVLFLMFVTAKCTHTGDLLLFW